MPIGIEQHTRELGQMTVPELRDRYAEVFGEATLSRHKQHLIRRITWRIQANREGGLSERARRRAKELACDADLRLNAPRAKGPTEGEHQATTVSPFHAGPDSRLPMPGALLRREFKGQMISVRVLNKGFEFEGDVYRSLSAIAKHVTGSHWNGFHFFGLKTSKQGGKP